jgi:hypothetical protein
MGSFEEEMIEAINGFVESTLKNESKNSILSVFLFDTDCEIFMEYYKVNYINNSNKFKLDFKNN